MSDRSIVASGFSVGIAVIGSVVGNLALSLAGPLLALMVHLLSQHIETKAAREKSELVDHLKLRVFQLEMELAAAKGIVVAPPSSQPQGTN
jgi:hypothetical protein